MYRTRILSSIIEEHAEEAAFLWLLRDAAVGRPDYSLSDLAELDERVEAHLDGLRVAGAAGAAACLEALGAPGEVFAAGVLALESGTQDTIDKVVAAAVKDPELERGLVSAFAWTAAPAIDQQLFALTTSTNPRARQMGVAGFAVRRQDPGPPLEPLLHDDDPGVRRRALAAVAELGRHDLALEMRTATADLDSDCRFAAASSAARLGDRTDPTIQCLAEFALQPGPLQETAIALAVRILDRAEADRWLAQLWQNAATLRAAAAGIGALGDPKHLGVLFQLMRIDATARVAGEGFSMITGIDLAYHNLDQPVPDDLRYDPDADAAAVELAIDRDRNLPWPNLSKVASRWKADAGQFSPGLRYLCGREMSAAALQRSLVDGRQRQRAAAALELALLEPHRPMFEARARGDWQRQLLPIWYPAA